MRLTQAFRSLLRRWYLTIPGLLATAGLCLFAMNTVPPTYEAKATVLLLPPSKQLPEGANPFLFLGGMQQAAEVLATFLSGDVQHKAFAAKNPTASYAIDLDRTTSGPVLSVTATDRTSDGALSATAEIVAAIPTGLAELEKSASVPDSSSIEILTLAKDEVATQDTKTMIRTVGAVLAAGLLGTLLLVATIDGLLLRRAHRRQEFAVPVATEPSHRRFHDIDAEARPGIESRSINVPTPRRAIGPGGRRATRLRPSAPAPDDDDPTDQAGSFRPPHIPIASSTAAS